MSARFIRQCELPVERWKNGRGWTSEVAIYPEGADLRTFDWRVSIAGTDRDAAFSRFPGIERTLLMLSGRIRLKVADIPATDLTSDSQPFSFSGVADAYATLQEGPITDFNVMTRNGKFVHSVERRKLEPGETMVYFKADVVILAAENEHKDKLFDHKELQFQIFPDATDSFLKLAIKKPVEMLIVRIARLRDPS